MQTHPPQPRRVQLDPNIAKAVATRLARGMHPSLIATQLSGLGTPDLIQAYVDKALSDPFFVGAMSIADDLRKRDWVLECQRRAWNQQDDPRSVARRDKLAADTFKAEFACNQRPAVISGLVDDWPALSLWNPDYLEQKIGADTLVEAQKGRSRVANYERAKERLRSTIPFSELAAALRSEEASNDIYVTANNGSANRRAFDPIWSDFHEVEGYTRDAPGNDGFLWIGPKGTVTPFHHDLTNNFLIQVKGRKRVHMIPNWEEARMRTRGKIFSDWSLEDVLKAGPKGPQVMETEIGPGDALFIPVGWWHHIVALDESYSVLFTNFTWPNNFTNAYLPG